MVEKDYITKPNKKKFLVQGIIIILLILLVLSLLYSLFYNKEINCNAQIEFTKLSNCTYECQADCVIEGFPEEENHYSVGEKIFVYEENNEIIKETKCVCNCNGCRG